MVWLSKATLDVVSKPQTEPPTGRARRRVISVGDRSEGRAGQGGPEPVGELVVTDINRPAPARAPADQWAESVRSLGKTESWEVDERSAQLQEMLQQVAEAYTHTLQQVAVAQDDGTSSTLETAMQQAAGTGIMDMRGPCGRYFYRELQLNKLAKAEFDACGKNYNKQRAFKAKFANVSYYDMLEQKRRKSESTFNLQSVDAEYCTFSRIVSREGGDLPAFETAKVFVRHAMLAWQGGKSFHGHAWVKHDCMRGGAVVLHYRETVSSGAQNIWDLATSEITTSAPHQQVENASAAPKPEDEEKEKPEEPIPKKSRTNPTGAAAGAAALAKFRAGAAAAATAVAAAAEVAAAAAGEESDKKNLQAALRKAAVLKLDVSKATQAGVDILTLVAQNTDWAWCNCDALLGGVRRCLREVEAWKKSTKFWQAWTLEDNLPLYVRKHFKPDQVIAAITEAHNDVPGSLKCLVETLHKETIKLKRMQASKNENL